MSRKRILDTADEVQMEVRRAIPVTARTRPRGKADGGRDSFCSRVSSEKWYYTRYCRRAFDTVYEKKEEEKKRKTRKTSASAASDAEVSSDVCASTTRVIRACDLRLEKCRSDKHISVGGCGW